MNENPYAAPQAVVADPGGDGVDVREVARAQRILLLSVLVSLIGNTSMRANGMAGYLLLCVFLAIAAFTILSVYKLCKALRIKSWPWIIVMFIPVVNLICLVALNQKATAKLKAEGIKVGLFGASV